MSRVKSPSSASTYVRRRLSCHVRVGDVWWDPDWLDEDSRDYLCLLAGLFETVLRGADAVHFRVLMKLFIKVRGSSFAGTPSL